MLQVREIWKAADLWAMLQSHYKVVIQSKHLCCTDSSAAVDGCKLIMNSDSLMMELMAHLFKLFTCFCWAVKKKEKRRPLQFSWVNWGGPLKMSSDGCFPSGQKTPGNGYLHFTKLWERETENMQWQKVHSRSLTVYRTYDGTAGPEQTLPFLHHRILYE